MSAGCNNSVAFTLLLYLLLLVFLLLLNNFDAD